MKHLATVELTSHSLPVPLPFAWPYLNAVDWNARRAIWDKVAKLMPELSKLCQRYDSCTLNSVAGCGAVWVMWAFSVVLEPTHNKGRAMTAARSKSFPKQDKQIYLKFLPNVENSRRAAVSRRPEMKGVQVTDTTSGRGRALKSAVCCPSCHNCAVCPMCIR